MKTTVVTVVPAAGVFSDVVGGFVEHVGDVVVVVSFYLTMHY